MYISNLMKKKWPHTLPLRYLNNYWKNKSNNTFNVHLATFRGGDDLYSEAVKLDLHSIQHTGDWNLSTRRHKKLNTINTIYERGPLIYFSFFGHLAYSLHPWDRKCTQACAWESNLLPFGLGDNALTKWAIPARVKEDHFELFFF